MGPGELERLASALGSHAARGRSSDSSDAVSRPVIFSFIFCSRHRACLHEGGRCTMNRRASFLSGSSDSSGAAPRPRRSGLLGPALSTAQPSGDLRGRGELGRPVEGGTAVEAPNPRGPRLAEPGGEHRGAGADSEPAVPRRCPSYAVCAAREQCFGARRRPQGDLYLKFKRKHNIFFLRQKSHSFSCLCLNSAAAAAAATSSRRYFKLSRRCSPSTTSRWPPL